MVKAAGSTTCVLLNLGKTRLPFSGAFETAFEIVGLVFGLEMRA